VDMANNWWCETLCAAKLAASAIVTTVTKVARRHHRWRDWHGRKAIFPQSLPQTTLTLYKMPSPPCQHGRPRSKCKDCGGSGVCRTVEYAAGVRSAAGARSVSMSAVVTSARSAEG